jgi:hypothetical protein
MASDIHTRHNNRISSLPNTLEMKERHTRTEVTLFMEK